MLNLNEYDTQILARWWNELNSWNWPEDMPGKPDNFEKKKSTSMVIRYMNDIQEVIGIKECYRYYHINICGDFENDFEKWWNKYFENPES
jgi:hypothetical protein